MNYSVCLRDFEERDIDFIHKCKNDENLNSLIVGDWHPFTYEETVNWVHGCMGEHDSFKFWAICVNDEEKKIVGWISLSQIDKENLTACHHGIVVGDRTYQDGISMFESMLLSMDFAFENLKLQSLYGSCLSIHNTSPFMLRALGFSLKGVRENAVTKNGKLFDVEDYEIISATYQNRKEQGKYIISYLIREFLKKRKFRHG